MKEDLVAKHWWKTRAADLICNRHPRQKRQLARDLAAATGFSETNTRHLIDRLYHLATCCQEDERITLMRLFPGDRQVAKPPRQEAYEAASDDDT